MYLDFDKKARDYILTFMNYFFPDKEQLITAKQTIPKTRQRKTLASSNVINFRRRKCHKIPAAETDMLAPPRT